MTDEDIRAFRQPPQQAQPALRSRRRVWPWLLLALAVPVALATIALVGLFGLVQASGGPGIDIGMDGQTWHLGGLDGGLGLLAVGALLLALVAVLLVVPVLVLLAVLATAGGVGVALLAALLAIGVATSPLLLLGALVWWALRPRRPPAASAAR